MCRSIKRLRVSEGPAASEDEIREAALQFVRKISGYRVPSQRNRVAFDQAVQDIARVSGELLDALVTNRPPTLTLPHEGGGNP